MYNFIRRIRVSIDNRILRVKKYHFPYFHYKYLYTKLTGKEVFSVPHDINEKIQWLSFHTDTTKWTQLADKYLVREYVKVKIGERYLIPLIGKWDKVDNIDWKSLPNKFIIKSNNSSGDSLTVTDKNTIDIEDVCNKLNSTLRSKSMYDGAERHYFKIKPCIIAEELLQPGGG